MIGILSIIALSSFNLNTDHREIFVVFMLLILQVEFSVLTPSKLIYSSHGSFWSCIVWLFQARAGMALYIKFGQLLECLTVSAIIHLISKLRDLN